MAQTAEQKLESANEKFSDAQKALGADPENSELKVKLRKAKKGLKRAQRRKTVENALKTRVEKKEGAKLKNIQEAQEKADKKKAAEETALAQAAEREAEKLAQENAAKAEAEAAEAAAKEAKAAEDNAAPFDGEAEAPAEKAADTADTAESSDDDTPQ